MRTDTTLMSCTNILLPTALLSGEIAGKGIEKRTRILCS